MRVERDLEALGAQVSPAQRKRGVGALMAALRTSGLKCEVGGEEVSAYDILTAVLSAGSGIAGMDTEVADETSTGDTKVDPATAQAAARHGITDKDVAALKDRYPGAWEAN